MKKKSSDAPAKAKIKAGKTVKGAAIAVAAGLGGGLVGAAIGRPSLGVGIATTIGGALMGNFKNVASYSWPVMLAGMAMAVAPTPKPTEPAPSAVSGLSGIEGAVADAKGRAMDFMKSLGRKTYIDKVSPEIATKMGLNGFGNAKVFLPEMTPEVAEAQVNRIIEDMQKRSSAHISGGDFGSVDSGLISELAGVDAQYLSGVL